MRPATGAKVQRFRCKRCRRTFSVQTFRYDYRQHRPELDALLFRNMVSGMGQRQFARIARTSRDSVRRKLSRLGRQLSGLHDRIARGLEGHHRLSFDELETFEHCRLTKPVTMATLIESDAMFVLDQACAPLSPRVSRRASKARRTARDPVERNERRNLSRDCVSKVLGRGAARFVSAASLELTTDRKSTYPGLARLAFGERLIAHHRFSSRMRRRPGSPMHRINLTHAMLRDNLGRLHRRSWLVSKCRRWLELHTALFAAFRNYLRPRFNGEEETPGQLLGLQRRRIDFDETLLWRHDRDLGLPIDWAVGA